MRTALNRYKQDREDGRAHSGESKTTTGLFSGDDDRLVYVDRAGDVRDYTYPLSGLTGIDRSRFGIETDHGVAWLDDLNTTRQEYYDDTNIVVTRHEAEAFTVYQYDLTLEDAHLTHVEVSGDLPGNPQLVAALRFAPDGQRNAGRLVHDDVVELYHDREHDYVTASTGLSRASGQSPEQFDELLADTPVAFPRDPYGHDYDEPLTDTIVVAAPLNREGDMANTTLVSLVADHEETTRADALARVRAVADHYPTDQAFRTVAERRQSLGVPDVPHRDAVAADLRALSLLTAKTGARIRGPECDPHHVYSGGYGYTWFRDDAETASALLAADEKLSLGEGDRHADSAAFYCDTQEADGTWPHRVWARNGTLAPGWANARLEGEGTAYQADQTASVVAFLATYLRERDPEADLAGRIQSTLAAALDGLDDMLDLDGVPGECQNVWENDTGRFVHTAATFLQAYAAVARAPLSEDVRERAEDRAEAVYDAIDEFWLEDAGVYARRERHGEFDDNFDASTLALVSAHGEYAQLAESLDRTRLDKLVRHVDTTLTGLFREADDDSDVAGLARFEGDSWRQRDQDGEKVWTLTTAWGANAAAKLSVLLGRHDYETPVAFGERARDLLALLLPGGPLCAETGYLSEQVFDDGTPDSATPVSWAHALRTDTVAELHGSGLLGGETAAEPTGPTEYPTWTTGEKHGVGTVPDHGSDDPSKVWFTLTEGALTEPRFPRADLMNFRSVDFLVADADDASSYTVRTHNETRKDDDTSTVERETELVDAEALVYEHTVRETAESHDWELTVEYIADPDHDALLLDVSFTSADDNRYDVYALAEAALSSNGTNDEAERVGTDGEYALTAWDTTDPADSVIVDEDGDAYHIAAALTSARAFDWATVDHAGADDLRHLVATGDPGDAHDRVEPGNVVLVGRVGADVSSVADTLAVGFAEDADSERALAQADGALDRSYVRVREDYVAAWESYLDDLAVPESVADDSDLATQYRAAAMTLKAVEDKTFVGAGLASPSVPWGDGVGAADPSDYGYNFTWSRDLYQVFTALEAMGDVESAREALEYVYEYQQRDGGFIPQNTYLDGRTRWGGEQMDNIAFPQVMAYQLNVRHGIDFADAAYDYEDVRESADYIARNGPHSAQERWEEEGGYSPSTIAAEIASLACSAALAADEGERADALSYLALADDWQQSVEGWCATEHGVHGRDNTPYYVRITRSGNPERDTKRQLANNGPMLDERDIVDAGFLELVRLGIKPWDDEVIRNSVAEVDETIRVDTPNGPGWYRYNGDGYGELGEHDADEGGPWSLKGYGSGRLWPIFTGERGEYELLADTADGDLAPRNLLATMQRFANDGRMIPEQVWDREYGTAYNWEFGEGTGAATPLAWSMAQYVRLAHGIDAGEPVETPAFVRERYAGGAAPEGPFLAVAVDERDVTDSTVVIDGKTEGDAVVVRTPDGTQEVAVDDDGLFHAEVALHRGTNDVTVVAANRGDSLVETGTSLHTETVEYEPEEAEQ